MTGVRPEWLASNDFVMIHLDLVDTGLSLEAALLLHRIHFRSGGNGWWYVTKSEMQADTRLSEWKLDRAIKELREHEMVAWERQSATNATLRWRVVYAEGDVAPKPPSREGGNIPQEKEETSLSSTKNVENNNPPSSGDDAVEKPSEPDSKALFEEWWKHYPLKVSKGDASKAFEKALKKVTYEVVRAGLVAAILDWRKQEKLDGSDRPTDRSKFPHAATWLNGERWADEHPDLGVQVGATNGEDGESWMHRKPER